MKQWEAIKTIVPMLKEDESVRTIFLKGSIAREKEDEYSDVDLYCLVYDKKQKDFLKRRLQYLKNYKNLLFWTEVNFVAPQIAAVFNNGLHFDLYTVTEETLTQTDTIKILYDPENLLSNYRKKEFEYGDKEIVDLFNNLTFKLLEFEAAYKRENLIWASRLASHISGDIVLLIRHVYDPKQAKLGFKKIHKYIPKDVYQYIKNALDNITPSKLPDGLIKLLDLVEKIVTKLSTNIRKELNWDFYKYMTEKIRNIK